MNPYTPGQPVDDPDRFVGRREVIVSIREQLVKGRRLFVVAGARRMGKTSLLRRLRAHLPDDHVGVQVALREENAQRFDWLLWRMAVAIGEQVSQQLGVVFPEPVWAHFDGHPEALLDSFWPQMRGVLGSRCLVLLLDDLDSLCRDGLDLLEPLSMLLPRWCDQDPHLALVVTLSVSQQEAMSRRYPRLFGGALSYVLGPLSSEEAVRLITWPVDGVITYDYGVPRRLVEVTSGQPYYLQLLCSEIYDRCSHTGWVNQRDVDLVIEGLLAREIAEFRQLWDESTQQEQAVLAALASLRGARGVATVPEVHGLLIKSGARVGREQVDEVLDRLAEREIVERLGAHSHRFRVALLREWLRQRLDLRQVVRNTRWPAGGRAQPVAEPATAKLPIQQGRHKERGRPGPPAQDRSKPQPEAAAESAAAEGGTPRTAWRWAVAASLLAVMAMAAAGFWALRPGPAKPEERPTLPASPTMRRPTSTNSPPPTSTRGSQITATPSPSSTATPSPTAPLIVARPVRSIAYLSKEAKGKGWFVVVMGSDGSNRLALAEASSDLFSAPSWSPDGQRIAYVSDRDGTTDIWVMDNDGQNPANLTRNNAKETTPAWSPDGQWIAFASTRDSLYYELYVMRPDGSDVQRLTWWEDASDLSPSWSPDGQRLAFASKRDGNWEIYVMDRDGSNLVRLTNNLVEDRNPAWSPAPLAGGGGGRIAFESIRGLYADIYVMAVSGGEAVNVTNLSWATDLGPTWSPDGRRIAFYSDRDGEWDIYVMNSDGSDVVKLTGDTSSDQLPAWRP